MSRLRYKQVAGDFFFFKTLNLFLRTIEFHVRSTVVLKHFFSIFEKKKHINHAFDLFRFTFYALHAKKLKEVLIQSSRNPFWQTLEVSRCKLIVFYIRFDCENLKGSLSLVSL